MTGAMTAVSESVRIETEPSDAGDIAVIVVDNPPVNALSWHVRQGLFDGLAKAVEDGAKAIASGRSPMVRRSMARNRCGSGMCSIVIFEATKSGACPA